MNPEITLTNYEEYLLLRTDGELSPAEDAALDSFLAKHPELGAEAAAYAAARTAPDETVVFADKASLLRSEAMSLPRRRTRLMPWSLAAAAVLLISVSLWMRNTPEAVRQPAGQVATTQATPQKKPAAPATLPTPGTTVAHPLEVALTHPAKVPAVRPERPEAPAHSVHDALAQQPTAENIAVARLDVLPAIPLPNATVEVDRTPEPILIVQEDRIQTGSQRLLQTLPLTKDRLAGLASLKEAAETQLQRVKAARQNLKNTEATFALAGHELFTVRF